MISAATGGEPRWGLILIVLAVLAAIEVFAIAAKIIRPTHNRISNLPMRRHPFEQTRTEYYPLDHLPNYTEEDTT
jgi:hypothetical protein